MGNRCIMFLAVFLPSTLFAASFDCTRVVTKVEKLICNDPELSKNDEKLAASYSSALQTASDPAVIKNQQREWLADVQQCDGAPCLKDAYTSRIIQLTYPEDGLWIGTIGNQEVMACFEHNDAAVTDAAYFYLQKFQRIALIPSPGKVNSWNEGNLKNSTGIWTFNERGGDLLLGSWSDITGNTALPIRLTRFKTLSKGDMNSYSYNFITDRFGCNPEDNVFNAAKNTHMQKEKISPSKMLDHNGRHYRVLSVLGGAVSSLELVDKTAASAELNFRLLNELKIVMLSYFDCPTASMGANRSDNTEEAPDYRSNITLMFWNERWISFAHQTSGDCGGAHPFSEFDYSTWDLTNGKKVLLGAWLDKNETSRKRLNKIIATKAVKQRLAFNPAKAKEENNCLDTISENTEYRLSLGKDGLIFSSSFPHVMQACNDNVEISYRELQPFMTKEGKTAMTAMIKPIPSREVKHDKVQRQ